MNDEKIDALCRRIYRNHRQALDLIYERVGTQSSRLLEELEALVRSQSDRWVDAIRTGQDFNFIPKRWLDLLPEIGIRGNVDPRMWIRIGFWCGEDRATFWCWGWPTSSPELSSVVYERLTKDPGEFGFRLPPSWSKSKNRAFKLSSEPLVSWEAQREPDVESLLTAARKKLDEVWQRYSRMPEALASVLPKS